MLEIEDNYFKHILDMSSCLDKSEGEFELMREYFTRDKLGSNHISMTDTHCWKFVTTSKVSTTTVGAPVSPPMAGILAPSQVITTGGHTLSLIHI